MNKASFLRPNYSSSNLTLRSWIGKTALTYLSQEFKTPQNISDVFEQSKNLVQKAFPNTKKKKIFLLNAEFFKSAKDFAREELEGEMQTAMLTVIRDIEREHFELEF